jgi:hypothetical protein
MARRQQIRMGRLQMGFGTPRFLHPRLSQVDRDNGARAPRDGTHPVLGTCGTWYLCGKRCRPYRLSWRYRSVALSQPVLGRSSSPASHTVETLQPHHQAPR